MDKEDSFPTEEEQYEAYKAVHEGMNKKPIVIRTLDIGGDKELPYFEMEAEMNPFLGYRAIRLCLDRKDILKTQLRALVFIKNHGSISMTELCAKLNIEKGSLTSMIDDLTKKGYVYREKDLADRRR